MESGLAPVVLFVHARPEHTKKTLLALSANELAFETDLYIYCDAARNDRELLLVNQVKAVTKNVQGFKSVAVIERSENLGLARSIAAGVTDVIEQHGAVIVLEDDLITDSRFLRFMNAALSSYEQEKSIWHINGWNFPIEEVGLPRLFFWRLMNCWGWATWADRWCHFKKDPETIIKQWSIRDRYEFNVKGNYSFFSHVIGNFIEKNNTWAVFWYATIFENAGLCLTPAVSFVENIGNDGTGTHRLNTAIYKPDALGQQDVAFPVVGEENQLAIKRLCEFLVASRSMYARVKGLIMIALPFWTFKVMRLVRRVCGR